MGFVGSGIQDIGGAHATIERFVWSSISVNFRLLQLHARAAHYCVKVFDASEAWVVYIGQWA